MDLKKAESIALEFKNLALAESAEVVPSGQGDWSVSVTATFRDSSIASRVLGAARVEEDFGTAAAGL